MFLDIGAHWGLYALKARQTGMFSQIVAFEPDPQNHAQLRANLFLNAAHDNIRALQLAATDADRDFKLFQRNPHNRGATRVVDVEGAGTTVVHGRRVDSLVDVSDSLLVIKIDVESHELETIAGMAKLLSKNRFVMQIEIWDTPKEESERRLKYLSELFAAHGCRRTGALDRPRLLLRVDIARCLGVFPAGMLAMHALIALNAMHAWGGGIPGRIA